MRTFDRQAMGNDSLVQLLIARGLAASPSELRSILDAVGYYRLSGYLYPFKKQDFEDFRPGTTLKEVWSIYSFDRQLRLMTMDALARIEVALRALIVRCHTDFNADPFAYVNPANMPKLTGDKHSALLKHIAEAAHQSADDPRMKQLKVDYGIVDYPPIWMMMEIVPMGTVTYYYHGLPDEVQERIADMFHVRPGILGQWLMALKKARNLCAHHARFWNCHIVVPLSRKIGRDVNLQGIEEALTLTANRNYTSVFALLSLCAYCMDIVRPQSQWRNRCKALIGRATPFILRGMGFPDGWQSLLIWK